MDTLQPTVFQVVGAIDFASLVTETILAGAVLGILVSLINMAGSRD
jgi:hypothetical protein